MRATIVAGVSGLILGHVLWVVAVSFAMKTTTVNAWVLAVAGASVLLAIAGGLLGRLFYRRKASANSLTKAWFAWGLPIAPVLLTVCVLGVTYL